MGYIYWTSQISYIKIKKKTFKFNDSAVCLFLSIEFLLLWINVVSLAFTSVICISAEVGCLRDTS